MHAGRGAGKEPEIQSVKHEIVVAGERVRYRVAGEGEPVILIHGLSGSMRWWRPILPALTRHYRVYLVDLPGFGSMARARRRFVLAGAASWLWQWMEAVGLPSADLVGHSMGGYICLHLAAERPAAVRRLVLVAPIGIPSRRTRLAHLVPLARSLRHSTGAFLAILLADALRSGPLTLWTAAGDVVTLDAQHLLPRIQVPVLLLWGARDPLVPPAAGSVLARGLADARLLVLDGAGHVPMFDRPWQVTDALLAFLAENQLPLPDSHHTM